MHSLHTASRHLEVLDKHQPCNALRQSSCTLPPPTSGGQEHCTVARGNQRPIAVAFMGCDKSWRTIIHSAGSWTCLLHHWRQHRGGGGTCACP